MSDMKCPFCGQKLESLFVENRPVFACCNLNCKGCFMNAPKELWQELIRTRKALKTLQEFITKLYLNGNITDEQLERYKKMLTTALEQKD